MRHSSFPVDVFLGGCDIDHPEAPRLVVELGEERDRLAAEVRTAAESARDDRLRAERAEAKFAELHGWLMSTVGIASSTRSAKKCVEDLVKQAIKANRRAA